MGTIREMVEALSRRSGVDAVVVVGRDGLAIDSRTANGVDAESVAALLPSVINGMAQLGQAGGRGDFGAGRRRRRGDERAGPAPPPQPFSPSKLPPRIAARLGHGPRPPPAREDPR